MNCRASLSVSQRMKSVVIAGLSQRQFCWQDANVSFLVGGMQGGFEAGFPIPPAGGDVQWMRDNMEGFKKKAADGHEGFIDMLAEIEERGLMKGANGKA